MKNSFFSFKIEKIISFLLFPSTNLGIKILDKVQNGQISVLIIIINEYSREH